MTGFFIDSQGIVDEYFTWLEYLKSVRKNGETRADMQFGRRYKYNFPLMQIQGNKGMGKTSLLDDFINVAYDLDVIPLIIDLAEIDSSNPLNILVELIHQYEQATGIHTDFSLPDILQNDDFDPIYKQMQNSNFEVNEPPVWLTELESTCDSFVSAIQGDGIITSILFHNFDALTPTSSYWLQEFVFTRLLEKPQTMISLTNTKPVRISNLKSMRVKSRSFELRGFSDIVLTEYLGLKGVSLSEKEINTLYTITNNGHPHAVEIVADMIVQGEITNLEQNQPQIYEEINNRFVVDTVLLKYDTLFAEQIQTMSFVRLFDLTMLRKLFTVNRLQANSEIAFEDTEFDDFSQACRTLQKEGPLDYDNGYSIDPKIRFFVNEHCFHSDVDTYIRNHQAALEVYQDWLGRPVSNKGLFIIESVYHQANLFRAGQITQEQIEQHLRSQVEELEKRDVHDSDATIYDLSHLRGKLEHDNETAIILGKELYSSCIQLINNRIQTYEVDN